MNENISTNHADAAASFFYNLPRVWHYEHGIRYADEAGNELRYVVMDDPIDQIIDGDIYELPTSALIGNEYAPEWFHEGEHGDLLRKLLSGNHDSVLNQIIEYGEMISDFSRSKANGEAELARRLNEIGFSARGFYGKDRVQGRITLLEIGAGAGNMHMDEHPAVLAATGEAYDVLLNGEWINRHFGDPTDHRGAHVLGDDKACRNNHRQYEDGVIEDFINEGYEYGIKFEDPAGYPKNKYELREADRKDAPNDGPEWSVYLNGEDTGIRGCGDPAEIGPAMVQAAHDKNAGLATTVQISGISRVQLLEAINQMRRDYGARIEIEPGER